MEEMDDKYLSIHLSYCDWDQHILFELVNVKKNSYFLIIL